MESIIDFDGFLAVLCMLLLFYSGILFPPFLSSFRQFSLKVLFMVIKLITVCQGLDISLIYVS
jgi:hypothetical protein